MDSASRWLWARRAAAGRGPRAAACTGPRDDARRGQHAHRHVGIGQLQGVHGLAELGIDIPAVGGVDLILQTAHLGHEGIHVAIGVAHLHRDLVEALDLGSQIGVGQTDVLDDGLVLLQRRLLLQNPHRVAGRETRIAVGDLLETRHDLEQRGLAHAVGTHDADLGARIERQGHVVEDHLVAMRLARLVHLIDEFGHGWLHFWDLTGLTPPIVS